eukprot:c13688_g1_i1 orf=98-1870(+)
MAFWSRQARRLPCRRAISVSGEHSPNQHTLQVSSLSHPPASESLSTTRVQLIGFGRNERETLETGRHGRSFLGFLRNEEQIVGFCRAGSELLGSGRNEGLILGLPKKERCLLGFTTESKGVLDILGFCKGGASSRAAEAALLLGFTGLALLSNAKLSYAEDEELGLQQQPEAKSNIHTAKWRIFTDKARDLCSQGSFENAEKFFRKALEEAKLGFGEQDPHVASCYNNLAELFRMKKEYDKAEPLYLEAVHRLRQGSGVEDGSVGFALHNLGGFYLLQRKLKQAQGCYEEALKIKGRALGLDHPEYANTMFHLGEVIRLQGHVNDGLALIKDSIRILEQIGLGNTSLAVKRLTRLSELLVFSGQLGEAEAVQRKVLQLLEFSKDFSFKDIVAASENLSATLQKQGKIDESAALLEQSIHILKENNGDQDIHMAALLLNLGGVFFEQGKNAPLEEDSLRVLASYDKAEGLLCEAVKIAELHYKEANAAAKRKNFDHGTAALNCSILLARCLTTLGNLRIYKLDIMGDNEMSWKTCRDTEMVFRHAISCLEEILVQQGDKPSLEVRKLYQECSQHLAGLNKRIRNLQSQGNA